MTLPLATKSLIQIYNHKHNKQTYRDKDREKERDNNGAKSLCY